MKFFVKSGKITFYYLSWFMFVSLIILSLQFFVVGENEFLHLDTIKQLGIYLVGAVVLYYVFRLVHDEMGYRQKKTLLTSFEDSERFTVRKRKTRVAP